MGNQNLVHKFLADLLRNCPSAGSKWIKSDCHFHTSASFDSTADIGSMIEKLTAPENGYGLAVATDHNCIKDFDRSRDLAAKKGLTLLPGAEVYAKIPAIRPDTGQTGVSYFHLLLIFDPNVPKLNQRFENLITNGRPELLPDGSRKDYIIDLLSWPFKDFSKKAHEESNALLIPAHLHTDPHHPEKSRSIDDILHDDLFLNLISSCQFDALEIIDTKTGNFFDGTRPETKRIKISCIRSSDAHKPDEIGRRPTWLKMEHPSFEGLKLALQDRDTRVALEDPTIRDYHKIIGARIKGRFFKNLMVRFSEDLNCLVGAKGKGKSAILECIRFALNMDVPEISGSSIEKQKFKNRNKALLDNILGVRGTVECLVQSQSGLHYLLKRSRQDQLPTIASESDGIEKPYYDISSSFTSKFYGWEELTACSDELNLLTDIFDTHFEPIKTADGNLTYSEIIRQLSENATDLDRAISDVEKKRDALIDYESIESSLNSLTAQLENKSKGQEQLSQCIECQSICTVEEEMLRSFEEYSEMRPLVMLNDEDEGLDPLLACDVRNKLDKANQSLDKDEDGQTKKEVEDSEVAEFKLPDEVAEKRKAVIDDFEKLVDLYDELVQLVEDKWNSSNPELIGSMQKSIEAYRASLQETVDDLKQKAGISDDSEASSKLDEIKSLQGQIAEKTRQLEGKEKGDLAKQLSGARDHYVQLCRKRSKLYTQISDGRKAIADKLTTEYANILKSEFSPRCLFTDYQKCLQAFFKNSGLLYNEIIRTIIDNKIMPESFCTLIVNWDESVIMKLFSISKEQSDKLYKHVHDNLVSKLKPFHNVCVNDQPEVKMLIDDNATADDAKYRVVSKLSAGERSTVILPIVTYGKPFPLIIDQPEDDLDNAYIHDNFVHSLLRKTKGKRQYIFATHNANIPVLGDAENIIFMDASRDEGHIKKNGSTDMVSQEIMEVLEGGTQAFIDRHKKYKIPQPQN